MIPLNKPKIWISLYLFVALGLIVTVVYSRLEYKHKYGKFIEITKDTEVHSKIIKLETTSRGITRISVENNEHYFISGIKNFNYSPSEIYNFIKVEDSISKTMNNDTIFIFREGNVYKFSLHHYIKKE